MDMKLRGIYIARQLSFQGVGFRIDEVELEEKMRKVYDDSVKFWVDLMHRYNETRLIFGSFLNKIFMQDCLFVS